MDFFKKIGAGSKKKSGRDAKSTDSFQDARFTSTASGTGNSQDGRRLSEDDPSKPNPIQRSKRDRNLSISRSGRHKYTGVKKRESLLANDIYSPNSKSGASGPQPSAASSSSNATGSSGAAGSTTNCRDRGSLSDSQPHHLPGQPTAV